MGLKEFPSRILSAISSIVSTAMGAANARKVILVNTPSMKYATSAERFRQNEPYRSRLAVLQHDEEAHLTIVGL